MPEYLYRVTARDKRTGEFVPVDRTGISRGQKTRTYRSLATAKGVRTYWARDSYSAQHYDNFRVECTPADWEVVPDA